jgi:CheY-like chemotaxis protein
MGEVAGKIHRSRRGSGRASHFRLATTLSRNRHVVLVVDDDHDLRESLRDILEDEGFETLGASNGKEAIDLLKSGNHPKPRVILLDIMMPAMTGLDVMDRLRRDITFGRTPIIFMTAFRTLVKTDEKSRVLYKPFSIERVLAAIRRAC